MTLEIGKHGANPYQRSHPVPPTALEGLTASSSEQFEERHSRQEERIHPRHAGGHPAKVVLSFSGHGLLGSPPTVEPLKRQAKSISSISGSTSSQFHAAFLGDLVHSQTDTTSNWLPDALRELDQIDQEAAEEGFPQISQRPKDNARRLIKDLSKGSYPAPAVYPTEDGEIAILFQKRSARSGVMILCDQDGGGACFSNISGKRRRERFDDASDLPDAFVMSELKKLGSA